MHSFRALALALAALAPASLAAAPQDAPTVDGKGGKEAYRPGERVPSSIRLKDIGGKDHTLLPIEEGELTVPGEVVTVVVFWSLYDPVARGYVEKLTALRKDFAEKNVEVYLIDSNHDEISSNSVDPLAKLRKFREEEKCELPILVDTGNAIADQFGALSNAEAFVIGSDRIVRYVGAIDDDPRGKLAARGQDVRPLLRDAVQAVVNGAEIEYEYTRPSGRTIKRAPQK